MASTKFDPNDALVKTSDRKRAEEHLARIKTGLVDAPDLLAKFITHDEWRLLGYTSLEDCFEKSGLKEAVLKGETSRKVVVDAFRKRGFTVRQIAATMEISPAQVSRIGSGKTGHEARDKELEGDTKPSPVTPGVTPVEQAKDEIGKPGPVKPGKPPAPDTTIKPTRTFTPGEVAEKSYGRHEDLVAAYNKLTDPEKTAFLAAVCLPGSQVTVTRRIDQLRVDLLTSREETRQALENANHDKHRADEDLDYDEMGNMLTRD